MALISKASQRYLERFNGIDEKGRYKIVDHMGKEQEMTGTELRLYMCAHSSFLQIQPEQPISEMTKEALKNKN